MRDKFPIVISEDKGVEGKFKIATSIQVLLGASRSLRLDLDYIERDYEILISLLCSLLSLPSKDGKRDPRLYWLAGDAIINFLRRLEDLGFYLHRQNRTIGHSAGTSESSIEKILSFRRRFPRLSQLDPSIPWNRYRGNQVSVPGDKGSE